MTKETLNVTWLKTVKTVRQSGSLYILLPKVFCTKNGIKEGDPVDLFRNETGDYMIAKRHSIDIRSKEGEN